MKDNIERIKEKWNENYKTYDSHHNSSANEQRWQGVLKEHIKENDKVVDVGCGTGFLTINISLAGFNVTGVDNSIGMMSVAKEKAKEKNIKIEFVEASLYETGLNDNTFDILTNKSVMWTLLEPEKAIKEWARVLKSNGKILSFISIHNHNKTKTDGVTHKHNHYDEDIEEKLPLKGAKIEDYERLFANIDVISSYKVITLDNMNENNKEDAFGNNWYLIEAIVK